MANKTSPHILSTAANLLGFCLFVITSLHIANRSQGTLIDEFTSVVAVLLSGSCLFSFFSIRTSVAKTEQRLEAIADYFFMLSLAGILLIIAFITFHFIR
jgi:hypothetical protein